MTLEEKALLMKEIVNILAKKECTVQDAEDILQGALHSVYVTSKLQKLEY